MNVARFQKDFDIVSKAGVPLMLCGAVLTFLYWDEGVRARGDCLWLVVIGFLLFRYRPVGQVWWK